MLYGLGQHSRPLLVPNRTLIQDDYNWKTNLSMQKLIIWIKIREIEIQNFISKENFE